MGYSLLRFICCALAPICLLCSIASMLVEAHQMLMGLPGMVAFPALALAAVVNTIRLYSIPLWERGQQRPPG